MVTIKGTLVGVIEGFYGRSWSIDTRLAYADYLSEAGLNACIYCPKEDPYLRRQWQHDWPQTKWLELQQLSKTYAERGIKWGVGLSPVELYRDYGAPQRAQLKAKLERLGELEAPLLAILFDDMPGNLDALASRQAEIVFDVCRWAPSAKVLVCPTYYSFDPVLEQHFGPMPGDYWRQLGEDMPLHAEIFWTGNQVCSKSIETSDLQPIVEQLGRAVLLWDNYPVNDGAVRSNFLYTSKLAARSADLGEYISGHLCNPMNQGLLSLPALSGLAGLYGSGHFNDDVLCRLLGPLTWERLSRDGQVFEQQGLSGMGQQQCQQLALEYAALPGAAALEVAQWLRGEYSFDPACLTD
ncbi:MAG: beta-N-acetylglucosaminidase domain-containing protein [Halioglobus sp.]|nr:beta-N-acetylglucosaminidase domain-containing protein [Halioglobus sp.]